MSTNNKVNAKDDFEMRELANRLAAGLEQEKLKAERSELELTIERIEKRWKDVRIPNRNSMEQVKSRIGYLCAEVSKLQEKQPDCAKLKDDYECIFRDYREHIRELIAHRNETNKIIGDLTQEPSSDFELIANILANRQTRRVATVDQLTRLLILKDDLQRRVRAQISSKIRDQMKGSEELTDELQSYGRILNQLGKRTHKWKNFMQTIPLPPYSRPHKKREARVVVMRECLKCGKEEKVARKLK